MQSICRIFDELAKSFHIVTGARCRAGGEQHCCPGDDAQLQRFRERPGVAETAPCRRRRSTTQGQLLRRCCRHDLRSKAGVNHRVVSQAVVIATGVAADGHREVLEVLGFDVGDSDDGACWTAFLRSLEPAVSPRCRW
jgi:hypothetical protein